MSANDELKRLAEAFPADLDWDSNTEPFFNGPSGESLGGGADGTYAVYGKPFKLEGEDYDYDGPTYVEQCGVDFAKFMVAAREGVLSLIAENDKLRRAEKNYAIAYKAVIERQEELRAEIERQSLQFKEWQASHHTNYCRAADERDQLKAENEELITAMNEILRVTPMGVEAFGIAALVLGEQSVSASIDPPIEVPATAGSRRKAIPKIILRGMRAVFT